MGLRVFRHLAGKPGEEGLDSAEALSKFYHLDWSFVSRLPLSEEERVMEIYEALRSPRIRFLQPLLRPILQKEEVVWRWPYGQCYYQHLFRNYDSIYIFHMPERITHEAGLHILTSADSFVKAGLSRLLRFCGIYYLDSTQSTALHKPQTQLVLPPDPLLWLGNESNISAYSEGHTYRFCSEEAPHFLRRSLSFYGYLIYRLYAPERIKSLHQNFEFQEHPVLPKALSRVDQKILGSDGLSELPSFSEARIAWAEAMLQ